MKARHGIERPEDVVGAPRIGADDDWAVWFASAGVTEAPGPSGPRLIADLQTVEVGAALFGHGVALGAPTLFRQEIASGRLVQLFEAPADARGYWLVYAKDRRRSPKIAAFREWLLARVAEDQALEPSPAPV